MKDPIQNLRPALAVDDSADDLFLLKRLLKKAGANVPLITFTAATEAVTYLKDAAISAQPSRLPCFVFTDLNMPTMNGHELLAWIRGEERLKTLPVMMLSSSDNPLDIKKSKKLGVDHYFVKFPSAQEIVRVFKSAGIVADSAPST